MAFRLARRAGRLDVDRMLSEVTPEQFDEWLAFMRIDPDPEARQREILKLGFSASCAAQGLKIAPRRFDPVPSERDRGPKTVSPKQAVAILQAAYPQQQGTEN